MTTDQTGNQQVTVSESSPVVHDKRVSDEKLRELLAIGTEHHDLDFKRTIDPAVRRDLVQLAKDVAAMQVMGGYLIAGVDDNGQVEGLDKNVRKALFDESSLVPKLAAYLPESTRLTTASHELEGRHVVVIYVHPNPAGFVILRSDGYFKDGTNDKMVFRKGDIYWRNGTRSERVSEEGFRTILERLIRSRKRDWIAEQSEIRRRELADIENAFDASHTAKGPLAAISFEIGRREIGFTALEMVRASDEIGLTFLLKSGERDAIKLVGNLSETELLDGILDKFFFLIATFAEYGVTTWYEQALKSVDRIYAAAVKPGDIDRFGLSTSIPNSEYAPKLWLSIVRRVLALGAVFVETENWNAIPQIVEREPVPGFDQNWLRQAVTMGSRSDNLVEVRNERRIEVSLLSLAKESGERMDWFDSPNSPYSEESSFTLLAQFDLLASLVSLANAKVLPRRTFYPNFARFHQYRVDPLVIKLMKDTGFRSIFFPGSDEEFAVALSTLEQIAVQEGVRFDGFQGWDERVAAFIAEHSDDGKPA